MLQQQRAVEDVDPLLGDGRATRWAGQQQRRRRQLVEAALVAIAEHGAEVSTEQIAARSGVARTRPYRHFAGAGELNHEIAARAEQMILAGVAPVGFVDAAAARGLEEPPEVSLEEMGDLLTGVIWSALDGVLRGFGVGLDPTKPLAAE